MSINNGNNQAQEAIEKRENFLSALSQTAIVLLSRYEASFEDTMTRGILIIADELALDRLSIWRNAITTDGLRTSQIYRWARDLGGSANINEELRDIRLSEFAPLWAETLSSGKNINGPVSELPEADFLEARGAVSAFVTPVFISNAFWGFVLFEDRSQARKFDELSADIMHATALMCANNTIMHEASLKEANP